MRSWLFAEMALRMTPISACLPHRASNFHTLPTRNRARARDRMRGSWTCPQFHRRSAPGGQLVVGARRPLLHLADVLRKGQGRDVHIPRPVRPGRKPLVTRGAAVSLPLSLGDPNFEAGDPPENGALEAGRE